MFHDKSMIALAGAASVVAASGAWAQPASLTDAQFLAVARCDGLADSKTLGAGDAQAFDSLFQAEGVRRMPDISDRADEARAEAMREAGHAGPATRLRLIAERDGVCQTYLRGVGGGSDSGGATHADQNQHWNRGGEAHIADRITTARFRG